MGTRCCVNELPSDAHATTRLANTAFEHVPHSKLAPNLLDVDSFAFVGEARITCDNEQRLEARQRGNDLLHHSISEVVLFRITAHVGEWQNSDGGLIRERQRLLGVRGRGQYNW